MNQYLAPLAVALSLHAACAAPHQLVKLWETPPVMFSAESVRYSANEKTLYVSNMGPIRRGQGASR